MGGTSPRRSARSVTFLTGNSKLVPSVLLLGSFLVPVTFVMYAVERLADELVTTERIFTVFLYGGVLGVLGASILEAEFLKEPSGLTYLGVGLIEEAVKLGALWLLAWRLPRYTMRDGIVFGAVVGFGFAAFETAGYAFNAIFTLSGLSLENLVETEILRGLLSPVGHGLWTAILGGVLFRAAASHGRLRLTGWVVVWYVVVALLHGLWDASRGIAVWLTLLLTATPVQWMLIQLGRMPEPTRPRSRCSASSAGGCCCSTRCWACSCCADAGARRWPSSLSNPGRKARGHLAGVRCAWCPPSASAVGRGSVWKVSSPSRASTRRWLPGSRVPARSIADSLLSSWRWMVRRSGRAPNSGWKPRRASSSMAASLNSTVMSWAASRRRVSSSISRVIWRSWAASSPRNRMISSMRLRNSGRKCWRSIGRSASCSATQSGVPPAVAVRIRSAPMLDVMMTTVFLKSTVRPWASVSRPASSSCSRMLKTSGCAFSISSSSSTE